MDELLANMLASLLEGQRALDQEVHPLLQAREPDMSMLERLRDVADEHAERARQLRHVMTERQVDIASLEKVDGLCKYFDGTARLIAQETGDVDVDRSPPMGDRVGEGSR
jgi:uncharacterized membrane protein YccC